ncbi:MAG: xanthine dehydrogenase family protein molybdopterin-binding subunit [Actinomycetota bacterium]
MTVIGTAVVRTDGEAKVRGDALYTVDLEVAGQLHGRLLRSPVPAGVIRYLDTTAARALPGVRAVLTAADAPAVRAGWLVKDQVLFASDRIRFEGEPIAAVAADTVEEAQAAVDAIVLEIEELPAVCDLEAALDAGAPLIHPDWERYETDLPPFPRRGNLACEMVSDPPGVDEAFARADFVVEGEYRADRQYQAYLEPKSTVAVYEDGRFIVHTGSQYPFNVRDRVAQFLDVRPSAVRIVGHHIGGGFGAKLDAALEPYAALLARATRRPVRLANTRAEDLLTCPSRENAIVRIRSAVTKTGEIIGRDVVCYMDNGAYCGEMPLMPGLPLHMAGANYRVGPTRVISRLVYTNTTPTGAFRGVGGTYCCFAVERHMDDIADRLGVDRREFRLRHLFEDGDRLLNGQPLDDAGILREAFDAVEERAPWKTLAAPNGRYRGVGLAAATWLVNPMPASVTLRLNDDGTVGLITAANDNGSGAVHTGLVQILADEFGVSPTDVIVNAPDTDLAGYDAGSQGSRTTHVVGRATQEAAANLKRAIADVAATLLEAAPDDIEIRSGGAHVRGVPSRVVSLSEIGRASKATTGTLTGSGNYASPLPEFNPACASGLLFPCLWTPSYHVHLAEVEVDPVTGNVHVLRYVVAQEVGRAINPVAVAGQIQGGVAQGLGYTLFENLRIEDGRYVERTLENYRLPVAVDIPPVEAIVLEHAFAEGPHGARGVAEPPILPVAAAIGNAVSHAIGQPITKIPITPEDVLAALASPGRNGSRR